MDGEPVWLASVSIRGNASRANPLLPDEWMIVPTGRWGPRMKAAGEEVLDKLLHGVGDDSRERCFRMNVTLCRHRALNPFEQEAVADWQSCRVARDLAGGPIEVMWTKGLEETPTTQPCESPRRALMDPRRPDLWLPEDCGRCAPCRARALVQRTGKPWSQAVAEQR